MNKEDAGLAFFLIYAISFPLLFFCDFVKGDAGLAFALIYAISFALLFFYDFVKSCYKRKLAKQNDIKQREQQERRNQQLRSEQQLEIRHRRKRDRTNLKFKNDKQRNTTNFLVLLAIKEAYKSGYHGSFELAEEEARRICRRIL